MKREEQLALKKVEHDGKVYPSNRFGDIKILEYKNNKQVVIMFLNTGFITEESMGVIRSGHIRDNEAFPVYKVGVMDIPNELQKGKPKPREYSIWNGIRQRCYNENNRDNLMSYKGIKMSDNFKLYSYFKEWCHKQIGFNEDGWHLDKDILVKGNKVYSEDTCCFVPPEINCTITNNKSVRGQFPQGVTYNRTKTRYRAKIRRGAKLESLGTYDTPEEAFYAYKPIKEACIKSLAEKWKDKIDPRVYDALVKWEINIDD